VKALELERDAADLRSAVDCWKLFQADEKLSAAKTKKVQAKLAELAVALVKSRNAELAAVKELARAEARHMAELQSKRWDPGKKKTKKTSERVSK
jgi:hypothetical protein